MKPLFALAVCILVFSAVAAELDMNLLKAIGNDRTRWAAHSHGAETRECFRVVDSGGKPVTNANVRCAFKVGVGASGLQDVYGVTDTNGLCTINGMCKAYMDYSVAKDGYYCSHGKVDYMETTRVPAVIGGKWQPYGETRTVVLKQIRQPQDMLGVDCPPQRKIRIYDEWLGVDLAKGDFVPPVGNGCEPDMLVRFHLAGEMPYDWSIRMDVSFTNSPYAGAYRLKMDNWSDMKSVYQADTNATYLSELSFRHAREKGKRTPNMEKLGKDEYLVFRTRTKVDGGGKLLSARYGKLYGPWHFEDAGGFRIHKVFLNRNDNDVNLEDTWTIENAKKYRSHLR